MSEWFMIPHTFLKIINYKAVYLHYNFTDWRLCSKRMDNNGYCVWSKKTMNHNFIVHLAVGLSVSWNSIYTVYIFVLVNFVTSARFWGRRPIPVSLRMSYKGLEVDGEEKCRFNNNPSSLLATPRHEFTILPLTCHCRVLGCVLLPSHWARMTHDARDAG